MWGSRVSSRLVVCLVMSLSSLVVTVYSTHTVFTNFKAESGMQLKDEFIYHEEKTFSVLQCVGSCLVHEGCLSASYNNNEQLCRLSKYRIKGGLNPERLNTAEKEWTVISKSGCFDGWIELGDECYLYYKQNKDNNEAKEYCTKKGAKLAEPQTNASFELLRQHALMMGGNNYWIGLSDLRKEGKYVWLSNGEVPGYAAWFGRGQNGQEEKDCIILGCYLNCKWLEVSCFNWRNAICEI